MGGGGWGAKHVGNREEGKKGGVRIGIGIGIPIRAFLLPLCPSPFCACHACRPRGSRMSTVWPDHTDHTGCDWNPETDHFSIVLTPFWAQTAILWVQWCEWINKWMFKKALISMAALKFGTHARCPTTVLAGDWYEHTLLSSTHAQNSGTIVGTGSLCAHRFC